MTASDTVKSLANFAGAHMPGTVLSRLRSLMNYVYTGWWMKQRGFVPRMRVGSRVELIRALARPIADKEVLYLEFGVWQGEATKLWSELLTNPATRLHGFDSFEGLPESWDHVGATGRPFSRGDLSTSGAVPQIADPRVKFFKGWFEDTLPRYEYLPGQVLLVFLDADLYSSTAYVLKILRPHIIVGTILYFDEFWDPHNEQRAFSEFIDESGMKFEAIAADHGTRHAAFRRTA